VIARLNEGIRGFGEADNALVTLVSLVDVLQLRDYPVELQLLQQDFPVLVRLSHLSQRVLAPFLLNCTYGSDDQGGALQPTVATHRVLLFELLFFALG
jgi:hypothetical protein